MKLILFPAALIVAAAWACFPEQSQTAAAPAQGAQGRSQPAQPQATQQTRPSEPARPGIFNPPPQTRPGLAYGEPFFPGRLRIRVQWPDGKAEEWSDVAIDRYTTLVQGTGR